MGVATLIAGTGLAIAVKKHAASAVKDETAKATAALESPGDELTRRRLLVPVKGLDPHKLVDNFSEARGSRSHEALDIMAPRGTPVIAVEDGRVAKLFRSKAGGITIYQFDPGERYVYYYAHLDQYAYGITEGAPLKRGDVIGYVGTTGNAPPNAPHLHFAIFRLGPEKRWWKGEAVNPFPYLAAR